MLIPEVACTPSVETYFCDTWSSFYEMLNRKKKRKEREERGKGEEGRKGEGRMGKKRKPCYDTNTNQKQ